MQVADIFEMNIDIAQLGSDQSSANDLAREYANLYQRIHNSRNSNNNINVKKPIALEHHVVIGLQGPGNGKMSKSNKSSAIFVDEPEESINNKIMNAYCEISLFKKIKNKC